MTTVIDQIDAADGHLATHDPAQPRNKLDLLLASSLFLAALAVRLQFLMMVPLITDETVEVLYSLKIARGDFFPLTNNDPYYGSLFNFIIAGVFVVFGPSAEHARLTITILGAAAVPLTYFLAMTTETRLVAVLASLMMLTSPALVLNDHVALENMITPVFATATLLTFLQALKRGSGKLLVASGFGFGLTLQTHPLVLALAPSLASYFLYSGLRSHAVTARSLASWFKSPAPYLSAIAVGIGDGNVILHNLIRPFAGWHAAEKATYAFQVNPTQESYLTNLQNYAILLLRMASGSFDARPSAIDYLLVPVNALYLAILALGLFYALRRGRVLPIVALATTGLLMPYLIKSYSYPEYSRYVAYLFPLLYLLIAMPLGQAVSIDLANLSPAAVFRGLSLWRPPPSATAVWNALAWLFAILVAVAPILSLIGYYRAAERSGTTNASVLVVERALRLQIETGMANRAVFDSRFMQERIPGGPTVERAINYLMVLGDVPHKTLDITATSLKAEINAMSGPAAVVLGAAVFESISPEVPLVAVEERQQIMGGKYGVYLVVHQSHSPAR